MQHNSRGYILLILIVIFQPLISWSDTFEEKVSSIYKKFPQEDRLYRRYVGFCEVINEHNPKELPQIIKYNTAKLKKKSEAYNLYRIACVQALWSNGFIKEAYTLSEELLWDPNIRNNKPLHAYVYIHTANLHSSITRNYTLGKRYYLKAARIHRLLKDTLALQSDFINAAQSCYNLKQFNEGDQYLEFAKSLERYGFTDFRPYILTSEVISLIEQQSYTKAQHLIRKNQQIFLQTDSLWYYSSSGMIDYYMDNLSSAEHNLLMAETLARHRKSTEDYWNCVNYLSKIYDRMQNIPLAFRYSKLKDSILELTTANQVLATIDSLKLVNAQKTTALETRLAKSKLDKAENKHNFLLIVLAVSLLVLVIVSLLLVHLRRKNIALVHTGMHSMLAFRDTSTKSTKLKEHPREEEFTKELNLVLLEEITDFLIVRKNFLQKEISMNYLTKKLKTNQHDLSETINRHFGLTLPGLVNKLRIHEAMKLLADENYSHYSIEGISREVGYESITTFNRNFKEIAGVTPSFFQKEALKISLAKGHPEPVKERA